MATLAATPEPSPAAPGVLKPEQELDRHPRKQVSEVVELAWRIARGMRWSGGSVSAFGAALIALTVWFEEVGTGLTTTEFLAVLIVGALLTLAGPLMIVNTNRVAQRTVADVAKNETEAARWKYEYDQLRLRNLNQNPNAS